MSQHNKKQFHKQERKVTQEFKREQIEQIELGEEDKWHPTPEKFAAYQLRDVAQCESNLRLILAGRSGLTLKELKDSTLHTAQTVESQVSTWLKSGYLVESKGRLSFNPSYQGR
jgi:hypothetical protein